MVKLVKEIEGFTFSELNSDAQHTAKGCVLEYEREADWFSEDIVNDLLESFGISELTPYFSLSYSQGDGLCLSGSISFNDLLNEKFRKIAFAGIHHTQIKSIAQYLFRVEFLHSGNYYYSSSVNITDMCDNDVPDNQEAIIEKVIANIKKWYADFCRQWEKRGYMYFYEISDDEMVEICEDREWFFTDKGKIIGSDFRQVG